MNVPTELLIALILAVVLALIGCVGVAVTVARSNHNLLRELQGLKQPLDEVHQKTKSLNPELLLQLDEAQKYLREDLTRLSENLKSVHSFLSSTVHPQVTHQIQETSHNLTRLDERLRQAIENQIPRIQERVDQIRNVLLGGTRAGAAAEHVVAELLSVFPPGWIKQDVHLGDGKVEFAVVLPGNYLVPLDSKFIGANILAEQDQKADSKKSKSEDLEDMIKKQAKEITKYLRDQRTLGFGIMVVPDSAYAVFKSQLRKLTIEHQIAAVPYSQLVPFVCSLRWIAQFLEISVRLTDTQKRIGFASKDLNEAVKSLENMHKEITALDNQRKTALDKLRGVESVLGSIFGLDSGPSDVLGEEGGDDEGGEGGQEGAR
jgi:DNA anti-recombination protein RmuC